MDLISLLLLTHETNEIKSPTNIYDFTVYMMTEKSCHIYDRKNDPKSAPILTVWFMEKVLVFFNCFTIAIPGKSISKCWIVF